MLDKIQSFFGFTTMPFGRALAPGMLFRSHDHAQAASPTASPAAGCVGPGRPVRIAPGGFPRPARRTRRATFTAPGAPRVLPVGQPLAAAAGFGVHGVGILLPR